MIRHASLLAGALLLGLTRPGGAWSQEPAPDKPLTRAQGDLIAIMSVLQIAGAACDLRVDSQLLGLTARQEGLTLKSEAERKLIATAMADARIRFSGQKKGVECLSVLDEYGPRGTRLPGLLRKK